MFRSAAARLRSTRAIAGLTLWSIVRLSYVSRFGGYVRIIVCGLGLEGVRCGGREGFEQFILGRGTSVLGGTGRPLRHPAACPLHTKGGNVCALHTPQLHQPSEAPPAALPRKFNNPTCWATECPM
jgi:hypothetical protein